MLTEVIELLVVIKIVEVVLGGGGGDSGNGKTVLGYACHRHEISGNNRDGLVVAVAVFGVGNGTIKKWRGFALENG